MDTPLFVGDKVGLKKDVLHYAGSWGIVRKVQNDEYLVAITNDDDRVHTYNRNELRKWRTPKPKSPESASKAPTPSVEGQLSPGQLQALRVDYRAIRALNGDRLFVEVVMQGKPCLLSIEGLTYGTLADYVNNNRPKEPWEE